MVVPQNNCEMLNYYYYYYYYSRKESFIIRSLHHKTLAVLFEQVNIKLVLFEQVNIRLVRLFFRKNIPDNRYSSVNEILNKRYFKLKVTAITENMLVSSLKKQIKSRTQVSNSDTHYLFKSCPRTVIHER